jgi:hypothetical protein
MGRKLDFCAVVVHKAVATTQTTRCRVAIAAFATMSRLSKADEGRKSGEGQGGTIMPFKVCSGPAGAEAISPMNKDRMLFKEFSTFDEALSWAGHMRETGRVALLIEDDAARASTNARSRRCSATAAQRRVEWVVSQFDCGGASKWLTYATQEPFRGISSLS